jgi:hypothetical protein
MHQSIFLANSSLATLVKLDWHMHGGLLSDWPRSLTAGADGLLVAGLSALTRITAQIQVHAVLHKLRTFPLAVCRANNRWQHT